MCYFHDQLGVRQRFVLWCCKLVMTCQRLVDFSLFKTTFDRVRGRCFLPTTHKDIQSHYSKFEACQRRKTPHRRPPVSIGHAPVQRLFQRLAINLVPYKPPFNSFHYILFAINHVTRFVILNLGS